MNAAVYFEKEVLVINFRGSNAYVDSFEKNGLEVTVTFRQRNRYFISKSNDPFEDSVLSDVSRYDIDAINKALPQYVEIEEGYWKKRFLRKKLWVSPRKKLKSGMIELQPSEPKTIITTQYTIIK